MRYLIRVNMAKKYYAIKKGFKVGIFETWDECKSLVDGFSGAEYKSFKSIEEAEKYIGIIRKPAPKKKKVIKKIETNKKVNIEIKRENPSKEESFKENRVAVRSTANSEEKVKPIRSVANVTVYKEYIEPSSVMDKYDYISFVDGSYDKDSKVYGSGVVIIEEDGTISRSNISGIDIWGQWNIVGELEATKLAILIAISRGCSKIAIYHDLKNISLWASGEWQAKNAYTQNYVRFIEEVSRDREITFIKVKSHIGIEYNEAADVEAKAAIESYNSSRDNDDK